MTYKVVPLASVAEVKLGRQRSPANHDGPNMRTYLRAANVAWGGLDLSDVKQMNFTDNEMATFRLQPGDLLLNEASGSPSEVGKPAIWQGEIEECAFQNTLLRVRPSDKIDSRYLLHFFSHQATTGAFARGSRGVGIRHLGRDALARWQIALPPIVEQRRIAAILDEVAALRAKRSLAIAELDALIASLLADTLRSAQIYSGPLSELVTEFRYGTSLKSSASGHPVLRIPNVIGGVVDVADMKYVEISQPEFVRLKLVDGDLLFVRTNGNQRNVGRCAVYSSEAMGASGLPADRIVYASYLIRARLKQDRIRPEFAGTYLNGPGRAQLAANSKTSAGQYNINIAGLGDVVVPTPPLQTQDAFVNQVRAVENMKAMQKSALGELGNLQASLQSSAFTEPL